MTTSNEFDLQGEPDTIRKGHSEEKTNGGQRTMQNDPDHLLKTLSRGI